MGVDYGDYCGTDDPMEISDICEGGMDPLNPFADEMREEEHQRSLAEARALLKTIKDIFPDNAQIQVEADYLIGSDWPFICLDEHGFSQDKLDRINKHINEHNDDAIYSILKYHADYTREFDF